MSDEDSELFYKLVKAGSKQAVKGGAKGIGLPDNVARFLASQLEFAYELLKKGPRITPGTLAILLARKGLGIANLVGGQRFDCAITAVMLGTSLTKAAFLTTFSGPAHFAVTAAELLAECYGVDKSCGISDAVREQVDKVAVPAYQWLDTGIVNWMGRGGY